jgi:hypothetical protein
MQLRVGDRRVERTASNAGPATLRAASGPEARISS